MAVQMWAVEENEIMPAGNEIVGCNLIKLRTVRGISQAELGRTSNVSQKTISNIEKLGAMGSSNIDTIEALASYFRVPLWQMFVENMPMDQNLRKRLNGAVQAMLNLGEENLRKVLERIEELETLERLQKNS